MKSSKNWKAVKLTLLPLSPTHEYCCLSLVAFPFSVLFMVAAGETLRAIYPWMLSRLRSKQVINDNHTFVCSDIER